MNTDHTAAIEAARHAIGLNLADATRAIGAAAPLIAARAAAAERERIARAIENDQHERNGCCACTVDAERHAAIARRPENT